MSDEEPPGDDSRSDESRSDESRTGQATGDGSRGPRDAESNEWGAETHEPDDPFEYVAVESDDADATPEQLSPENDEPLADLTKEIEQRRRGRERDDLFEDTFEDLSVESLDADAVWEQLSREDAEPTVEAEPESDFDSGDRDIRVIEKRTFCQGCQYFSPPPTVACTHEGTEILELVDVAHFRVADCPMVAGAERLTGELEGDEPSEL